MVLGIILGPIAEDNFLQGKLIGEAGDGVMNYFFTGTINIILILATIGSILYSVYASHKIKQRAARA